jgi:outer membrane protein OmpA-like peptidoglycan-associated protein
LIDENAAYTALSTIIDYLQTHEDAKILIAGATAHWGSEDYVMNLSRKRAERIGELIAHKGGISSDQMVTTGVGWYYEPFYTDDQTSEGKLDSSIAPLNRTVNFVLYGSSTAEEILACAARHG